MSTTFKGPVVSTNGFTGALTGAVTATTASATTSLTVGGGTAITRVSKATVSVVIPAVAASSLEDVEVTVAGATAGDLVIVTPLAAAMETDLGIVGAFVSEAGKVKIRFYNNDSGNAATGSTSNFQIALIRS